MTRFSFERPVLVRGALAVLLLGLAAGVTSPALADYRDRGWRDHAAHARDWRRHHAHGYVYAPPTVYAPAYASPGINLVFPLNIR